MLFLIDAIYPLPHPPHAVKLMDPAKKGGEYFPRNAISGEVQSVLRREGYSATV